MKNGVCLFAFPAFLLLHAVSSRGQVVINEYCAANVSLSTDNFGENSDWVELYNAGATPVNLAGYWMSDKLNNIQKWQMPAINLNPGQRVLIWCSGRNITTPPFHTNFGLRQSEGNDHIILADPAGNIVDSTNVRPCMRNHSRGRAGDGGSTWGVFTTPTPNAPNGTNIVSYANKPDMSIPGGIYAGPVSVTLSTQDPTLTIRYTTNGSTPTATSTPYTGPININTTTVLRAGAFSNDPGVIPGFVETHTYFIGVNHSIPIVSVWGDQPLNQLFNGTQNEPDCGMEYFSSTGALLEKTYGNANKHGNDSWAYQQRGIDYIVRDKFGYAGEIDHQIFAIKNRSKFDRVILKAAANDNYPFANGAHVRDAYVHTLSLLGGLDLDVRTTESVVLYKNGQYWGVYEIREKTDDKDYIKHYYNIDEPNIQYLKTWGGTWAEYGGPQAQADWNALRQFILNNDMGNPVNFAQVDAQLNWRSLIDYFCINSYTVCSDWLNWNTAWWRGINTPASNPRSKWSYALWDMDATFGHYINYTGIPNTGPTANPCNAEALPNPGGQGHTQILTKLITENEMVYQYYVSRYIDLGNTIFSCQTMMAVLDSMLAVIAPEMPAHIARWGGSMAAYNARVQQLKDFIQQRCVAIENGLVDCYDLEGPYPAVFTVNPIGAGTLQINSLFPANYPFAGTYYGNIDIITKAFANPGWVFSHWETVNGSSIINPDTLTPEAVTRITAADTIIAHFVQETPPEFALTVLVNPPLSGNVNVAGFTPPAYPWTGTYFQNTAITMAATPVAGYEFDYWELNNHAVLPNDTTTPAGFVITEADTLIAHFKLITVTEPSDFPLVVNVVPPQGGKVNLNSFLINVYPYTALLDSNSLVLAEALPSEGFQFTGWTILHHTPAPSMTTQSVSFKIKRADTLTAYFEELPAELRPNPLVFIPNTFTPNNDPINGVFRVVYNSDVISGELLIFDRWGEIIFSTQDLDVGWDGTFRGIPVPTGVYGYILRYKYNPGRSADMSGSVLLIR